MSLDGIILAEIKNDLKKKIIGARIDKIYQPEDKLLTFNLRQAGENLKLLISVHPQNARLHFTKEKFENPLKPPAFCMLLRKYLIRGIITEITQPDFERILQVQIKVNKHNYTLLIEIMGKYSNLILVNEKGIILDAIKRITNKINRERELYPRIKYFYPPKQDKLNPLLVSKSEFNEKIPEDFNEPIFKLIMSYFRGIGPDMAKEISYQTDLDLNQPYSDLDRQEKNRVWQSFHDYFLKVKSGKFQPTIGLNEEQKIIYCSAFPLKFKKETKKEINFTDTEELFDYYFKNKIKRVQLKQIKQSLNTIIRNYLNKNKKKQKTLRKKLSDGENAARYKKSGELIIANIYHFQKKTKEIEVIDYFDPEQKMIKIPLDPKLTLTKNAQKYFKKYNKAKKSVKYLKHQIGKLRHEEKYLKQVEFSIDQAESKKGLLEIREELREEGYIKKKQKGGKNKRKKDRPLPPYQFKSSQGYIILVGKNNHQNDYLTKKIAKKNDLWLHIKELPGSHVIIRNHDLSKIPNETLKEAASLAAYYSKEQMSKNIPIDYTEVKNVKKPKGAKPGLVYYENFKTLYVTPDKKLIEKLRSFND